MPGPGAAEPYPLLRPTVHPRPIIHPVPWEHPEDRHRLDDPYVRRYWVPVLGPGAIADFLRLATAASRGRSLPRPRRLPELGRAGLVRTDGATVLVRTGVPPLPAGLRRRLPPNLRRELTSRVGTGC